MSSEAIRATPEKLSGPQPFEQLDGQRWFLHEDGSKVPFTSEEVAESERQAVEYLNGNDPVPAPGMPKFPRTLRSREMNIVAAASPAGEQSVETSPSNSQSPVEDPHINDAQNYWARNAHDVTSPLGRDGRPIGTPPDNPNVPLPGPPGEPPQPPQEPPPGPENQPSPHEYVAVEGKPIVLDQKRYVGLTIPTLDEIQANPEAQQLFGELLSGMRPDKADLFGRMRTMGKMDKEEEALIEYCQHEYARRLKQAEAAGERITPQLVQELTKHDEDLRRLVTRRGANKVVEVMRNRAKHMAMRNEVGFEEFAHATHALHENRDTIRFKRYQNGVQNLCQTVGIDPKDYDTFFALDKSGKSVKESLDRSSEVRARVREQVRADMGRSRRAIDTVLSKVRLGSAATARYADRRATFLNAKVDRKWFSPQSWVLGDVNANLKAIAAYAGYTLADAESNPEIFEALMRGSFTGEGVRTAEEIGPQSRAEAETLLSEKSIKTRLDSFKQAYRAPDTDHDWAHMTPEESSAAYQTFQSREMRSASEGKGMWASIFSFLMQALLAQRVNAIEKKRVLA